jgi:hypothetical protein
MSKTAPVPHDDLDNYDVGDLSDDPFRTPTPPPSKKRKEADSGLGIDTEVAVQKRARVPNIKLDEDRCVEAFTMKFIRPSLCIIVLTDL